MGINETLVLMRIVENLAVYARLCVVRPRIIEGASP